MNWIKSTITTTHGAADLIAALLQDFGVEGVQIEDAFETAEFLRSNETQWDYADEELLNAQKGEAKVIFYLEATHGGETLAAIKTALKAQPTLGEPTLESETVNDESWLHEWKKHYKPFKIGERIIVKPIWEEYTPNRGELVYNIDPGSVFGTGLHQTTQLCVALLEQTIRGGESVLDIGCGSGILFVTALLLGAKSATATDIEPAAAIQAQNNAALNGFGKDKFAVHIGNVLTDNNLSQIITEHQYNIVLANIVADAVIALAPLAAKVLKTGGTFMSSGIIREKAERTKAAITACGFEITGEFAKDEWVALRAELRK